MKYEVKYKLKELRLEKGYTQKQVAAYLNKSETGYASWEQGLAEPSINDIIMLCKLYSVSADYILGLEN